MSSLTFSFLKMTPNGTFNKMCCFILWKSYELIGATLTSKWSKKGWFGSQRGMPKCVNNSVGFLIVVKWWCLWI